MASIHRKVSSGVWYITYRQGGKQRHRSLKTKDERLARRLQRDIELRLSDTERDELVVATKSPEKRVNPEVGEFWRIFSTWAMAHRTRSTVEEYRNWFHQFVEYTAIARMGDATKAQAESFKSKLRTQGKNKSKGVGLRKTSVNSAIKTLKSIWNHGIKLGLYSGENPFSHVESHRLPKIADRGYLDGRQIESLIEATERYTNEKYVRTVEARNVRIAIAMMALAGLRKGEVCFAKWDWIRWDERILVVSNHEEFTTKNKLPRTISMHEDLVRILEPHRQADGYILSDIRSSQRTSRYRADFRKGFNRVCELASIRATPHDLRHSFASRHAVKGRSLHVIAGWLGHSTTWVTERYAHYQHSYDAAVNDM